MSQPESYAATIPLPEIDLGDPAVVAEFRRIRKQMRRLITLNGKTPGGEFRTNVGDVAKACRMSPVRVAAHMRIGWWIIQHEDGAIETWTLEEDGE